jgi:hypothetical protein
LTKESIFFRNALGGPSELIGVRATFAFATPKTTGASSPESEDNMSKLKISEKVIKTRNLIFGLRDARVAALLRPYGFVPADLEEGWNSVMTVAELQLKTQAAKSASAPSVIAKASDFEDHWMPIVKIVLERRYPGVAQSLYQNLVRAEGKDATTTAAVFLDRLDVMEKGEAPYGAEGPRVREYLRGRGLSDAVIAAAKASLDQIREVEASVVVIEPVDPVAEEAAVKSMWDWYLEWSRLARRVIKDGNLLRLLGFKKLGRRRPKKAAVVVVEEKALPAALPALKEASDSDHDTAFAAE